MTRYLKTKYPGVRVKEAPTRKHKGKPDLYFTIYYTREGRTVFEGVGFSSEGIDAKYASAERAEIVKNIRLGTGCQSLKEKRELESKRKADELARKETQKRENMPFDKLAIKYIEWAKGEKKSWKNDQSLYLNHVKSALGNVPIKDISMIHLEKLKRNLQIKKGRYGKKLSDATIKHCLVLIRQMFNRAISWRMYQGINPVTATARENKKFLKTADNKRVRFLNHEEADLLLDELKSRSQLLHDICLLSLYTGMRMGEVFNLNWNDVNLEHNTISIKDPKSGTGRNAYITPPLSNLFQRMKKNTSVAKGLLFKDRTGKKIREISNVFERVTEKLGLNKNVTDQRDKVVAHTLRHTFASWLAAQGEPIITIQKLMGHSSLEMTLRYAHLSPSHERDAVLKLAQGKSNKVVILKTKN
ncbi:MAG TPA: site-specific integrase [Nitrospinaceae bacterium]|nr:site-specific integrase [Nitrospinaceae bacterium]